MPAAMTRKIISQARQQQDEIEKETRSKSEFRSASSSDAKRAMLSDDDDDDDNDDAQSKASDDEAELEGAGEYYEEVEDLELSEQDAKALDFFMGEMKPRTLADMIMEKIGEREAGQEGDGDEEAAEEEEERPMPELPPKVIEVYEGVGAILKKYRQGKLPKAFKIVPRLENWEEVLYVTDPESWSPAATREATRLFASNLKPKMAQRFFNLILLPAVQDDIKQNGKLNFHLYLGLKKALYKPAAFFKGVLLPLCDSRCTLREALIISSVLQKVSIPMLHSAVAILKLAEMHYSGSNALFLRTLLLKKYALPYKVIDRLVEFFCKWTTSTEPPPVLWQQTLLSFVQHYKAEVTAEQKSDLKLLLRATFHPAITPEIRRELFGSRNRGDSYLPAAGSSVSFAEASGMEL